MSETDIISADGCPEELHLAGRCHVREARWAAAKTPAPPADPIERLLAVECPECFDPEDGDIGKPGFPCLDVGAGRVQMACLSRIRLALTPPGGRHG